jgi:hypothetical protein
MATAVLGITFAIAAMISIYHTIYGGSAFSSVNKPTRQRQNQKKPDCMYAHDLF